MPRYSVSLPAFCRVNLFTRFLISQESLFVGLLAAFVLVSYMDYSIPEGNSTLASFISLIAVVSSGHFGGKYALKLGQDPMLGMLFAGILCKYLLPKLIVPIPHTWTAVLWTQALASVLARAGLSLQKPKVLPHLLQATLLGTIPILMETVFLATAAKHIFVLPTNWAFTLAFGVACISPGVVVPILLNLLDNGWKASKLPPMLLTAVGIDVLWGTAGFGIFLASCFGHKHEEKDDWDHSGIGRGLEELAVGLILGALNGFIAMSCSRFHCPEKYRTYIAFILSALTMTWCKSAGYAGAASCSTFITWSTIANTWSENDIQKADQKLKHLWITFKPFLFPVIGATITLSDNSPRILIECFMIIIMGILIKMVGAYLTSIMIGYDGTESVFISGVWSGKASIQVRFVNCRQHYAE